MSLEIEKVRDNYDLRGGHRGRVIVFADSKRPFTSGNILDDFAWRRSHEMPYPTKEILKVISPELKKYGISPTRITYNKKAGCSMCPCSPGYVVYDGSLITGQRIAIWLKENKVEGIKE